MKGILVKIQIGLLIILIILVLVWAISATCFGQCPDSQVALGSLSIQLAFVFFILLLATRLFASMKKGGWEGKQ